MASAIKYETSPCIVCLSDPSDFDTTSVHVWYGHSVKKDTDNETYQRKIHGICSSCLPEATAAQKAKCDTCSKNLSDGSMRTFALNPDGSLQTSIEAEKEEAALPPHRDLTADSLRRRNVVQITVDTTAPATQPEANSYWKKVTIGVSGGVIAASVASIIAVSILCPPALPAVLATGVLASFSSAGAILCSIDPPPAGRSTRDYGPLTPSISYGS